MSNSWNRCFEEVPLSDISINRAPPLRTMYLPYGVLVPENARLVAEGYIRAFRGPLVTKTVSWYIIMRWCKRHSSEQRFIMRYHDETTNAVRRAILFKDERNVRVFKNQWVRRYPLD